MNAPNQIKIEKVQKLINESLIGLESYLSNWAISPKIFTNTAELNFFIKKLREMKNDLDNNQDISILGLWRIMETWPYNNELRKKIVEAEYSFERLKISSNKMKHHDLRKMGSGFDY